MRHCKAKNAHGAPCGAPESLVDAATGFCPSHGPGASQRMVEIGRKGAEATKRKYAGGGLPSKHLGSLETIKIAARSTRLHRRPRPKIPGHSTDVGIVAALEALKRKRDRHGVCTVGASS